jgi:alkylation response protein AidB-like acyl-CoA dehydrogenase
VIDLAEDEDQTLIAETARRVLARRPGGAAWQECADLGWLALALPEACGGVGLGPAEQAVLFRELGRALADGPFLATTVAAHAALACGQGATVTALTQGRVRAALAEPVASDRLQWWSDGEPAGVLLVRHDDGSQHLLDAADVRVVDSRPGIDDRVRLSVGEPLASGTPVPADVGTRITRLVRVLTAALLAGIAERTVEMSVSYARDRSQYGKPIGSFQVIKHRCADMAVRAEAAWAVTALAAVACAHDLPHAELDAAAAWTVARSAALTNARDNIQNHGAIGFTAEHGAQRYVKRAHVWSSLAGPVATAREVLVAAPDPW